MSEKDIQITADPETIVDAEESSLPNNILAVGEISTDDVKVYIKQDVYHAIEKRSASNMTIELGSILLGKVAEVFGKRHVIITACIEAKYTDASSSTLTFTHETWDYVNKVQEEEYSGLRIVGWQHTHPGYGIFLSNYDMFIQENFFNLPFQIAYVVDPKQKIRGFFQWQNEKVERLKGFYLFDDEGKKIEEPTLNEQLGESSENTNTTLQRGVKGILTALTCVLIAVVVVLIVVNHNASEQLSVQANELSELNGVIATLAADQSDLQGQIVILTQQNDELKANETVPDSEDAGANLSDTEKYTEYTVKPGDTLFSICVDSGIDYENRIGSISGLNHIDNPDEIKIGQVLLLPIEN